MIWVKFCGYSDLFFLFSRVGRQAFSAREAHSKDPTPNAIDARIFQKALALNVHHLIDLIGCGSFRTLIIARSARSDKDENKGGKTINIRLFVGFHTRVERYLQAKSKKNVDFQKQLDMWYKSGQGSDYTIYILEYLGSHFSEVY